MAEKKMSCGGFYVDDETLTIENGVLKIASAGGLFLIKADVENPWNARSPETAEIDKTWSEITEAFEKMPMAVEFVSARYSNEDRTPAETLIAPCVGAGYTQDGALNQINFSITAKLDSDNFIHSIIVNKNGAIYHTINL